MLEASDEGEQGSNDYSYIIVASLRDVQGSAGVGVYEQTLEHELAERKRRVHVQQQNMRN